MAKVNRGDLVRVDWDDHFSSNMGWKSFESFTNSSVVAPVCSSLGIVVGNDDKFLTVSQNWHLRDDGGANVADFMCILKNNINKITVIKKKELK
jgi:hypothetical protein